MKNGKMLYLLLIPLGLSGPAQGQERDADGMFERYDRDGNEALDLQEFEFLYAEQMRDGEASPRESRAVDMKELRKLRGMAVLGPDGKELGRVSGIVKSKETQEYFLMIPAGELTEAVGVKYMVVALKGMGQREDAVVIESAEAVQAYDEEKYEQIDQ